MCASVKAKLSSGDKALKYEMAQLQLKFDSHIQKSLR
jgi:hypothetical protein